MLTKIFSSQFLTSQNVLSHGLAETVTSGGLHLGSRSGSCSRDVRLYVLCLWSNTCHRQLTFAKQLKFPKILKFSIRQRKDESAYFPFKEWRLLSERTDGTKVLIFKVLCTLAMHHLIANASNQTFNKRVRILKEVWMRQIMGIYIILSTNKIS